MFYPEDQKVGVKTIKTYAERMRSEGVSRAIMVTIADITPFAKQCLVEMRDKFYIESVGPCSPHVHLLVRESQQGRDGRCHTLSSTKHTKRVETQGPPCEHNGVCRKMP